MSRGHPTIAAVSMITCALALGCGDGQASGGAGGDTGAGSGPGATGPGTSGAGSPVGATSGTGMTGSGSGSAGSSGAGGAAPTPPPGEPFEGFGATTPGGDGGKEIHITQGTDAAVRAAWKAANQGNAVVIFDIGGPIAITSPLPLLTGAFITIDGRGVTLDGSAIGIAQAMIDVRGHDVIVQNMRLRNAGDNLRAQEATAYNIVFSHISSTGSADDGISIGYGAHDVTVQYCFLAGDTRSIFIKYGGSTNITIHHTWIMKQWIRGPIVDAAFADLSNLVVEDWTLWGTRFEAGGGGNAVDSLWRLSAYAKSLGGKVDSSLYAYLGANPADIYVAGNAYQGAAVESPSLAGHAAQPFPAPKVTTLPVAQMEAVVTAKAGCLPRDAVDQAYINLTTGWDVVDGKPLRLP